MLTLEVFVGDAGEERTVKVAKGEFLRDALTARQQHGPFCRLVKLGPAWWQRGREFGFLICHSGKHFIC